MPGAPSFPVGLPGCLESATQQVGSRRANDGYDGENQTHDHQDIGSAIPLGTDSPDCALGAGITPRARGTRRAPRTIGARIASRTGGSSRTFRASGATLPGCALGAAIALPLQPRRYRL